MIGEYKKADIDAIVSIWLKASIIAHDFIPAKYWESKAEDIKNEYIPMSQSYVYEEKGEVFGFISLIGSYIVAVFVNPDQQGKGIGKALIEYVKASHEVLELSVYAKNERSIAFYLKQGFEIEKEAIEPHTGEKELQMKYKSDNEQNQ